jgi:hypothetical protein
MRERDGSKGSLKKHLNWSYVFIDQDASEFSYSYLTKSKRLNSVVRLQNDD